MNQFRSLRFIWSRAWNTVLDVTSGGSWSNQLPGKTRRSLRAFFMDGVFATASDSVMITYITLFALAYGATRTEIGLWSSFSSLFASLMVLLGAMLTERYRKRKLLVLISGGGFARLMIMLLCLVPLLFSGQTAVIMIMTLSILRDGFNNMGAPPWTSLTANIVPLTARGRFFGTRNFVLSVAGMITIYLIGYLITRLGFPWGYQVSLGIALILGLCATFSYAHIIEPPFTKDTQKAMSFSPASLLRTLLEDRNYLAFCISSLVWNFALSVAGPFFNVYLVQDLKADPSWVGAVSIVSNLSGLPAMRLFGYLNDRWGPRRVQLLCGLIIPILPFTWIFTTAPWHAVLINIAGGFLWAGYTLASFNFQLGLVPPEQQARYTAIVSILVVIAGSVGSALGGLIATHWSIKVLFVISSIGRYVGILIFARFVHAPKPSASTPAL